MRRHPKASSARSNPRQPAGPGSSPPSGRLRLALLLATAAAFLLVPAAQAFAATGTTTAKVKIAGSGSGEVSSVKGFIGIFKGVPPIECSYASPGPATGICEDKMSVEENIEEFEAVGLNAVAAPGSVIAEWSVEGAAFSEGCGPGGTVCAPIVETGTVAEVVVTATFKAAFPLTLEKIGTGEGTVVSNPAGINCGPSCSKEKAEFEKEKVVTLTASAASNSVFTSWSGCNVKAEGRKCEVKMSAAETVKAKFTKVQPLAAVKDPTSSGEGTLSSSPAGIVCSPSCAKATALFTEGAASFVKIKAAALSSTSEFDSWTKCPGTEEGATCKVAMTAAQEVEAKFKAIPRNPLKLAKEGAGTGTVTSSPAGISCGQNCSSAEGSYLKTKSVTLTAVASKGSTFGGWSGDCSGTGTCTVAMSAEHNVTAEFK